MKKVLLSTVVVTALLFSLTSYAQTNFTLDYSYAGFSADCNVFATSKTLVEWPGFPHLTSFGFPSFSSGDGAIVLQSKPGTSTTMYATEYSIAFPFQQNHHYQIQIYGEVVLGDAMHSLNPTVAIKLSTTNDGTNTSTNCTGPVSKSQAIRSGYAENALSTTWTWSGLMYDLTVSQAGLNYLLVAGFPNAATTSSSDNSISKTEVRKIQIVDLTPSASVSLSPATLSKACGTALSATTFTATPTGLTGTVSYTWNVGTSGYWKRGGVAVTAPFSTGSTNSVSLTADACVNTPPNVSVTASNGTNSASASTTVTQAALSISGPASVCGTTGSSYTIANLACAGATINWSVTPSGLVTPTSGTGTPFTLTRVGSATGYATLSATVSGACGSTGTITLPSKSIFVGTTPTLYADYTQSNTTYYVAINPQSTNDYNQVCYSPWVYVNLHTASSTSVTWTKESQGPGVVNWTQNGNNMQFYFYSVTQYALFKAVQTSPCGGNLTTYFGFKAKECTTGGGGCKMYTITPNPVHDQINIIRPNVPPPCGKFSSDGNLSGYNITKVNVYDNTGLLKLSKATGSATQVSVNASNLRPGYYIVEILSAQNVERQNILVK